MILMKMKILSEKTSMNIFEVVATLISDNTSRYLQKILSNQSRKLNSKFQLWISRVLTLMLSLGK